MGGGLMQLVAYGAQDIYLTGNPQITFFKVVYRRHTNFSMESIKQTFSGTPDFGKSVTATISRNGDLIHRMYLEHFASFEDTNDAPGNSTIIISEDYGSYLMKDYEIEIGGQKIDKHYGHWHSVYSQLNEVNPDSTPLGTTFFDRMAGNGLGLSTYHPTVLTTRGWTGEAGSSSRHATLNGKFWIPLHFWFCRNPGLALPLIALQYHEVKIKINFEENENLVGEDTNSDAFTGPTGRKLGAGDSGSTFDLWCDYIYLDTDERRRFAQVSHEYLIEQLQFKNGEGGTMELNFNHPVKELIWSGIRVNEVLGVPVATNPTALPDSLLSFGKRNKINHSDNNCTYQLRLNGHDRFSERDYRYFTRVQKWQTNKAAASREDAVDNPDTMAVYSFALKPNEHQPSGTCNFSRIDNAELVQNDTGETPINIYAINYNVLRIMSGMGGLAYSN